jgi:phosphonate transport system ATP-binding protein
MAGPEFVIADEPTASLDPSVGQEVMDLFATLTRESGIAVLFTSHDLGQALRYADRIIGLRAGRIELDEDASRAARSRLERLYA